jgi:glucosamine-phosphate N-acetyltransferase
VESSDTHTPSFKPKQSHKSLVEALVEASKAAGCYKVILDCAEHNVAFYEKCGLARKEVQMARYL